MARPRQDGLLYFSFDTDFFYADQRIKRLHSRYGSDGMLFFIYLLTEIYRNGYYIRWDGESVDKTSSGSDIVPDSIRSQYAFSAWYLLCLFGYAAQKSSNCSARGMSFSFLLFSLLFFPLLSFMSFPQDLLSFPQDLLVAPFAGARRLCIFRNIMIQITLPRRERLDKRIFQSVVKMWIEILVGGA